MKFSMAVPTCSLEHISDLLDYDFVLAQHVLADKAYAEFYAKQKAKGRYVFMDNGFHETGRALPVAELIEACKLVHPSVVVAPDALGKPKETLEGYETMRRALATASLPDKIGVAVVLQGSDFPERAAFFEAVRSTCDVLCFPFRADRLNWMYELYERVPGHVQWPPRIHLLGMKSFQEIKDWVSWCTKQRGLQGRLSFDTTKPLKYGLLNQKFPVPDSELRGKPGWPKAPCNEMSTVQWLTTYYNLAYLRRYL